MVKAQEWLDRNYLKNIRSSITGIDISNNEYDSDDEKLSGSLKLENFHRLEKLNCRYNLLTSLDLSNCFRLEEINCSENKLMRLTSTNSRALKILDCSNNHLSSLNLDGNIGLLELRCSFNQLDELSLVKNNDLTKIYCSSNHLSNLDLNENVKLIQLNCSCNKLERLNLSKSINLDDLSCRNNLLTSLDLSQNSQLTDLGCSFNQINELIFPANNKIENICCNANLLTQLNWSRLNPNKLGILLISDNNFSCQNLEFLEPFANLSYLYLGTSNKELIQRGIYNRFQGSLKPLRNLKNLVQLDIHETDIDSGLEYLPSNLKSIMFDHSEPYRKEAKVNQLFSNLRPYRKGSFSMMSESEDYIEFYDLQEWRKANEKLIKKVKEEITSEVLLKDAKEQISQLQKELAEEKNRRLELERQLNNLQISDNK
ncbi:L domain-like protein [Rhizophagus irregularis]|uniref:L domain-like protein n=1 Tax=Rhizophagus irregularis TaxID=588596 RepID=A0A2I1GPF3_9GLOM|nr:L domain-like protein [Rhizophagus irregularis]